jgi:hydroxyethylthiazole kinase-like uncharacterized protein yjeF
MGIPVFSVAQIREIEAQADALGYANETMMQDAGRAVAERAVILLEDIEGPRVTVLCGKGNNGGDGLVAAAELTVLVPGIQVRAYLLDRREGDPLVETAQDRGVFLSYAEDDHDGRVVKHMSASADLVIDALFGIGVRLPIRDTAQRVMRYVRQSLNERNSARRAKTQLDAAAPGQIQRPPKQYVLAVDCPSGTDCDSGAADSVAIQADITLTFIAAKPGLLTFPASGLAGQLIVVPLSMPESLKLEKLAKTTVTDNETARDLLPARPLDGHKGTFGRVLLVAGSDEMPGAAGLAARSAYRAGAGLVEVATTPAAVRVLQTHLLEAVWTTLDTSAIETVLERLSTANALVIGPGMGSKDLAKTVIISMLKHAQDDYAKLPVLIDADGLNALAATNDWPKMLPPNAILTPHPGEMARLTGVTTGDVQKDRMALAAKSAADWNAIVVFKGAHTVVAAPDGRVAVSPFKSDALAKGGTGDVLSGLIGGLCAQGLKPYNAAVAGVYVHGLAGMIAAERTGYAASVLASEVADAIPAALGRISDG